MPVKETKSKKQHNAVPSFSKLLRKLRSKSSNDASTIGGFPVSIGEIRSMRLHKYSEITSGLESEEHSNTSLISDGSHSRSRRRRANNKNQNNKSSHGRSSTTTSRNELNLRSSLSCSMRKRKTKKERETKDGGETERVCDSGFGSSRSDDRLEIYEQSSNSSNSRYSDSAPKEKDAATSKSKSKPNYSPWDKNGVPPPPPPPTPPPKRCGKIKSRNKKNKSGAFPSLNGQTFRPKATYASDNSTFFSIEDDENSEITGISGISGISSQSTPMEILKDLEDLNPIMEEPESAESGTSDEDGQQLHSQKNRQYLFQLKEAPQIEEQPPPSRGSKQGSSRKLRTRNLMAKLVNTVQEERNPNQGEKEIGRFVERDDTPKDEDDIPFDCKQDHQQVSKIDIRTVQPGTSDIAPSDRKNEAGTVTLDESEVSCIGNMVQRSIESDIHQENRLGTSSLPDSRFEDEDPGCHPRTSDLEKPGTLKTKKHSIKQVIRMMEEGTVPPGFPETISLEPSTRSRSTVARELESIDKMVEMCNERGGNYQETDWMEDSRDPPSADEAAGEQNLSSRVDMAYSPSPRTSPSSRPDPDGYVTPSEELFGLAVINETDEDENERTVVSHTQTSTMSVYDSVYSFCGETIRSL